MDIVLLGKEDAKALSELEKSCFSSGWTAEEFSKILFERKSFDFSLFYPKKEIFLDMYAEDIQEIYQCFSQKRMPILGLFSSNGDFLGYISIRLLSFEAEVYNIAIKKEARGQNLGSILMGTALSLARLSGVENIFLEVRETNIPAIILYKKMGFLLTGVRKSYYPDGENALLMTCKLDK